MPGGSNQNTSGKTVQTLLAAKKNETSKDSSKEKPAKQNKRSHSDVAEESVEGIDLMSIHNDLKEIKQALQGTVTKSDLTKATDCLVQQKDLKSLVTDIVNQLLVSFEETVTRKITLTVKGGNWKITRSDGCSDDRQ